jgi:hypothetical protein
VSWAIAWAGPNVAKRPLIRIARRYSEAGRRDAMERLQYGFVLVGVASSDMW